MTNDCKTCPVSTGTHKPAEALHQQIAEPQPTALGYADAISAGLSYTAPHILALAADELRAQHTRIAELEAEKVHKDHERRAAVAAALGLGNANFAWSYLHGHIKDLVKCEEELIALRYAAASWARAARAAVPDGWKLVAVNPEFDNLMYWLDRCHENGHLEQCSDLIEPWLVFDYDSKTNFATHPTTQGLGERKDRDTIFFLAGWNGCNEGLDANEQFKKAEIAAQAKQGEQA